MQKETGSKIFSVSELTKEIKFSLEESFDKISVIGEISNFKAHISGHWYFILKDSDSVINCTMWRGLNEHVYFTPQNGMKVILNGKLTVYAMRGNYQIDVRSMKPSGLGELQEAFEKLKQKLELEGLFDEAHKKQIPQFPVKIGIVTAAGSAALEDIISVAERRYPNVELNIAAAKVQGSGAAEMIVNSIERLNREKDIDVIIVARGGGSIEDLWAFNEEIVARAIFGSKIPVISGIGHEVDFTISDYVTDLRAPTPSVAMELATPDIKKIFAFISDFSYNASNRMKKIIDEFLVSVNGVIKSYAFRYPLDLVRRNQQEIDSYIGRILQNSDRNFLLYENKVSLFTKTLEIMDIQKTLNRGFVLVKQNSKFVTRAADYNKKKSSDLKFVDGEIKVNP
jgi:exodeoxyribonuclease VII large subunit